MGFQRVFDRHGDEIDIVYIQYILKERMDAGFIEVQYVIGGGWVVSSDFACPYCPCRLDPKLHVVFHRNR